jgi:Flp pilus assembly protein TadD
MEVGPGARFHTITSRAAALHRATTPWREQPGEVPAYHGPRGGFATGPQSGKLSLMRKLAAVVVLVAALAGSWFYFQSRVVNVWLFTDYSFRFNHADWPALVESRFREVNRIYQRNGAGIRWKVIDASLADPTSHIPGIDNRRANMVFHVDDKADVFVVLSGVRQGDRTGSVSPFSRVVIVVDFPDKSESQNARLLAYELTHLFGAPNDPAWLDSLMAAKPESDKFPQRTIALIHRMRNYPFALGLDALSQGSWEKKALNALAEGDRGNANAMAHAHLVLGTALLADRKNDDATAQFRLAVQQDPKNATARLDLAEAYTRNSRDDLALEQVREVVRLAPNDPLSHRALGALLGRNHQPDESVRELQIAARMEPDNPNTRVLLGIELAVLFHLEDSTAALQEAVQLNPDAPLAREGLEKVQLLKQRLEEALVVERGRLQRDPNDPDAHYRLARAEERSGDLAGAIHDFQKAAELRPASGTPHVALAEVYIVQGDSAGAWQEIGKARALGTEPPPELIARLESRK